MHRMKSAVLGLSLFAPLAACGSNEDAYNAANTAGNLAVRDGQFEVAIAHWEKAAALDPEQGACRGEFQRVQIRAARDAVARQLEGKLMAADVVAWFDGHSAELWMPNACNTN